MKRVLVLVAIAAVALMALTGASAGEQQFRGTVYLGMDTPLTGPQAIVGQGDREAVLKLVRYWNNRGGINGRRARRRHPRQRLEPVAGRSERPALRRRLEVRRHPRLGQRGARP